jgi:hypothetical protein
MRAARLSIGRLMIAIAIVAGGLGVIHLDRHERDFYRFWHEYVIGIVPMACLLVFGLITGLQDLLDKRECRPFLVGFEAVGWVSLFLYASFLAVNHDNRYRTLARLMPVTSIFYPNGCAYADISVMILHIMTLFLPAVLLSLAGGLLCARLGITVVRKAPERIG